MGISANLAGGGVLFELGAEMIHFTTETQRPQRAAIFLCLSGDADKQKGLSLRTNIVYSHRMYMHT